MDRYSLLNAYSYIIRPFYFHPLTLSFFLTGFSWNDTTRFFVCIIMIGALEMAFNIALGYRRWCTMLSKRQAKPQLALLISLLISFTAYFILFFNNPENENADIISTIINAMLTGHIAAISLYITQEIENSDDTINYSEHLTKDDMIIMTYNKYKIPTLLKLLFANLYMFFIYILLLSFISLSIIGGFKELRSENLYQVIVYVIFFINSIVYFSFSAQILSDDSIVKLGRGQFIAPDQPTDGQ